MFYPLNGLYIILYTITMSNQCTMGDHSNLILALVYYTIPWTMYIPHHGKYEGGESSSRSLYVTAALGLDGNGILNGFLPLIFNWLHLVLVQPLQEKAKLRRLER